MEVELKIGRHSGSLTVRMMNDHFSIAQNSDKKPMQISGTQLINEEGVKIDSL